MLLQSKAIDIGQQTVKTLLHVQVHPAFLEGFPHNLSNVPKSLNQDKHK
jgi:hypothetical protein